MEKRLDTYLVEQGLSSSNIRAQALIIEGKVYVDGRKCEKASFLVQEENQIQVREKAVPYVSRGGLKLKKALDEFGVKVKGRKVLDVGTGSGGFTDCLLKEEASKVIAVDVGYGQFDWKLRNSPKVFLIERTNVRYLKPERLPFLADLATVDCSFISIRKIFPNLRKLLKKETEILFLAKPQFEAAKNKVEVGGVVKSPQVHIDVLTSLWCYFKEEKCKIKDLTFSPLLGKAKNIEFWFYLSTKAKERSCNIKEIRQVVKEAHQALAKRKTKVRIKD